ncbi:MAG: hypothetical protein HYY10_00675 [Candidatus Liptonbacteria bacterium]|nr:hypothetical protein [Candidatus Liptonbacteria bacterium]
MATIVVRKEKIQKEKGVVILPIKEYQKLLERAVPEYCLTGKAAKDLDKLVEEGLKAERAGKTRIIESLADLE